MTESIISLARLRETVAAWRQQDQRIALVPTMGALHAGHMALVAAAKKHADRVVVSIFVNPTQFGPKEDYSRYPRTLEADLELLEQTGADAAWVPDAAIMYPKGFSTTVTVKGVSEPLEGWFRPGHFDGVATVVAKLFNQVQPDIALFGEKDFQQLALIKRMANDLSLPLEILPVPTIREDDGLALSSRNRYLTPEQREAAASIHAAMKNAAVDIQKGLAPGEALMKGRQLLIDAGFSRIDYFDLRDPDTFESVDEAPGRLLVAAWLGTTRLIDNMAVE